MTRESLVRTRNRITQKDVKVLKWMLYNGASQAEVAKRFNVSQGHVSKISHGRVHARIPWPDGTIGPSDVVRYMMEGELIPRVAGPIVNPQKADRPHVNLEDIDPLPEVPPDIQADASPEALDKLLDIDKEKIAKRSRSVSDLEIRLDAVVEEQLLGAIEDVGDDAGEPTIELSQAPVDRWSWARVCEAVESGHPLIDWQEHMKGDDKLFYRECIGILFASMKKEEWFTKSFYDNLIELAGRRGINLDELFAKEAQDE